MAGFLKGESTRELRLAGFLADAAGREFTFGDFDCALMPANWCKCECDIDPAATIRDRYSSDKGWRMLVKGAAERHKGINGMIALWRELAAISDLATAARPAIGDIGLVRVPGHGIFGGVCGPNGRWIVKLKRRGLVGSDFKYLQAWNVPCRSQ